MKLVIQRVSKARVKVRETGVLVGEIDKGLFVLIGIKNGDSKETAQALVQKLLKLRIMADEDGKMNLAATSFLLVSQFTLYANTKGGNRPSFVDAASPLDAKEIYNYFVQKMKEEEVFVATGSFGDYMDIEASLDGPVTIVLDSDR